MRKLYAYTLSVAILIASLCACTHDYFEDETNLRIFVPELADKSLTNFHIFLYDADGVILKHREVDYPFDEEVFIEQGIIRYTIPPGSYNVTCFANTYRPSADGDSTLLQVMRGGTREESYVNLQLLQNDNYKPASQLRKVISQEFDVVPYGLARELPPDTVHISSEQTHTGIIEYVFKGLPAEITRLDVYTWGLSSRVNFEGKISSDGRAVFKSVERLDQNTVFSFSDHYFPSILEEETAENLYVKIDFLDSEGNAMGTFSDQLNMENEDGTTTPAVLESNTTLTIIFDGFFFSGISLEGWGDIDTGEVTPM
ncbi:MAG: hypothetical protein ACK5LR_02760 [Mangrovibacterium sp.]